jgi:putative DNA primase/helicase
MTVHKLKPSIAERLMQLFPTNTHSHATYDPDPRTHVRREKDGKIVPVYRTVYDPITLEIWECHLAGTYPLVAGLGCDDGTTKVSVADIDDYSVNAIEIAVTIKTLGLPMYIRKSKSGGAHIYVFHAAPISIAESVKVSRGIARLLGYADKAKEIEYFPRVQKPDVEPKCLNMPYLDISNGFTGFINTTGGQIAVDYFLSNCLFLTDEQRATVIKTKEPRRAKATSIDAGHQYAEGKLRRYENELRDAALGTRNDALNERGYWMGQMVAREWIKRSDVEDKFTAAIAHWDDKEKTLDTLKRALDDGEKNPHPDLTDEDVITEDSVALEFAERHAGDLRYDHDVGSWYQWVGSHWRRDKTALAFSEARDLVRELSRDQKQRIRNITSKASFAGSVERYARADRVLVATQECWDQGPFLLGTPGGTVDLRSGVTCVARQEDGITKITAVTPAEKADCPLWEQFLKEATAGDNDLIEFLQDLCGYAMTGDISEHLLVFIYGPGGNGKTVFVNTIGGILGNYHTAAPMGTFTETNSDRHPTDLAGLRGARLVTSAETDEGRAWAETRIKQATGGDPISARFMRQDFFTYKPAYQLFIIGNHKPKLRNITDAMRRRLAMVPFFDKPEKVDKKLEEKLQAEWPGILRWMIDGCLKWQAEGIEQPGVVLATTKEYFEEQDLFGQWADEWLERAKPSEHVLSSKLYESWAYYAHKAGENPRGSPWFNEQMKRKHFVKGKSDGNQVFRGVRFKKTPSYVDELAERFGFK